MSGIGRFGTSAVLFFSSRRFPFVIRCSAGRLSACFALARRNFGRGILFFALRRICIACRCADGCVRGRRLFGSGLRCTGTIRFESILREPRCHCTNGLRVIAAVRNSTFRIATACGFRSYCFGSRSRR